MINSDSSFKCKASFVATLLLVFVANFKYLPMSRLLSTYTFKFNVSPFEFIFKTLYSLCNIYIHTYMFWYWELLRVPSTNFLIACYSIMVVVIIIGMFIPMAIHYDNQLGFLKFVFGSVTTHLSGYFCPWMLYLNSGLAISIWWLKLCHVGVPKNIADNGWWFIVNLDSNQPLSWWAYVCELCKISQGGFGSILLKNYLLTLQFTIYLIHI